MIRWSETFWKVVGSILTATYFITFLYIVLILLEAAKSG